MEIKEKREKRDRKGVKISAPILFLINRDQLTNPAFLRAKREYSLGTYLFWRLQPRLNE